MSEPRVCVLCHEAVVVGADASKWGMAWHGSDWVHLDCAENIGESARRVQSKPTIKALERLAGLLRSVILSGERWTETLQKEYDAAR